MCLPLKAHLHVRHTKWMIKLLTAGTTTLWSKLAWNLTLKYPSILTRMSSLPLLLGSLRAKIVFPKFDNDPADLELLKWATKQLHSSS